MSILTTPMTYDELIQLPADGNRYEIIAGELHLSAAPTWYHQLVLTRLLNKISRYLEERRLPDSVFAAPVDVRLTNIDVVEPDIVYVSPARRHLIGEAGTIDGAPDLLIEILSPSTRTYDQRRKAELYAAHGVTEFWLVDGESKEIRVLTWRDGTYVDVPSLDGQAQSLVLTGLTVDPVWLFAKLA